MDSREDVIKHNHFNNRDGGGEIGGWKEGDTIVDKQEGKFVGSNTIWGGESNNITTLSVEKGGIYVPSLEWYALIILWDITKPVGDNDIPFLWHIPKSSGSKTKMILTQCFGLRRPEQKL